MGKKIRSHRYCIKSLRSKHEHKYTKYKMCLSMVMLIKQHLSTYATFEAQFMKKLSSTEAELKKSVGYKKSVHL